MATIQEISQAILINPLFEYLKFLYGQTGSFGVAIILLTLSVRTVLIPFTLPTLRSQKKMKLLKPQIDLLKEKFKQDPKKLQQAQMELFKEHNINPIAGCLPYLAQLVVIFALYNVLSHFVSRASSEGLTINTWFMGWDLAHPDKFYVIPVLAALTQFVLSLMLLPGIEKHDLIPNNSKKPKVQAENKKENDSQQMAETMQKQMVFMMPIMTGLFALRFPSGLGLYWIVTTIFSIAQQWVISGPGGLKNIVAQVKSRVSLQK
ncbi:membrane protein insertase YidC [Candidatus Woesebacteria bacterium]|nr:membrane protein insertase YidC [Candidatus Woesebacteria bacterium]